MQSALSVLGGGNADPAVVRDMAAALVDGLMGRAAERLNVERDTLFPMRRPMLNALAQMSPPPAVAAPAGQPQQLGAATQQAPEVVEPEVVEPAYV